MIDYKAQLNLGNEAFGTEKTITANEVLRTAETDALAREIAHQNPLIPEQVAEAVLQNFCKAACELMAMGFAIQLRNGDDVAIRILPDIHVKGGNINLARAKKLDPTVTELTLENAGDLIDKAGGVTCRVRAIVQQKFTDLLNLEGVKVKRTGVVEVPYVQRKSEDGEDETEDTGNSGTQNHGGGTSQNGGGQQTAQTYNLTIGTSGSGTATVTCDGNAVSSGAHLNEDDEVEIQITPAEGQVPTATINGSQIELTEDGGVYSGSFAMPGQSSTLMINTGSSEGGDGGEGLDKD